MAKKNKISKANNCKTTTKNETADECLKKEASTKAEKTDMTVVQDAHWKTSNSERGQEDGQLFPSCFPWLVCLLTSVFRVLYVIQPHNWWVLHPDEIFQSLEVAHSEVYGYGLRTYEFMRPATGDNLSHYQLIEKEYGMYSMRSPLMPQFYIMVWAVCRTFGLDHINPYILWRVSHVLLTSCLPMAVYTFLTAVTLSKDVGGISAALTALSSHLNVLGTHTLVNSFISPFLFWSMSVAVRVLRHANISATTKKQHTVLSCQQIKNSVAIVGNGHSLTKGHSNGLDQNVASTSSNNVNGESLVLKNGESKNHVHVNVNGYSRVLTTQSCDSSFGDHTEQCNASDFISLGQCCESFIAGIVMCLSVYVRPDAAILVLLICLPYCYEHNFMKFFNLRYCNSLVAGGAVGLLLAIANDYCFYGCFTISPWNWLSFNVITGKSGLLFGKSPLMFYFHDSFVYTLTSVFAFVTFSHILFIILKNQQCSIIFFRLGISIQLGDLNSRVFYTLTASACVLLALYSYAGHKEMRFIHDVIVLYLAAVSCLINALLRTKIPFSVFSIKTALFVFLVFFAAIQWKFFQEASINSVDEWPFKDGRRDHDTNECLHYVSQQHDVTGLFMEKNLLEAGSFPILHKNVPIFFQFSRVNIEFDQSSLIKINRPCLGRQGFHAGYYSLNVVSDLIHEKNSDYLKKRIIESKHYNYAIISSRKDFFYPAFVKVFARKDVSVWRRTYTEELETTMAKSSSQIPEGGFNATLMEVEAEILKQMGIYQMALKRFSSAVARGGDKVEILSSMAYCYHRLRQETSKNAVLQHCVKRYSRDDCLKGAIVRVKNLLIGGEDLILK